MSQNDGIQPTKNQYTGVNAHAIGYLQSSGEWLTFHNDHITHIKDELNTILPPEYIAVSETSLQIRQEDQANDDPNPEERRPDITVFSGAFQRAAQPSLTDTAALISPTLATMDLQRTRLKAVVVREVKDKGTMGRVVLRWELLSPGNEPGQSGYSEYRDSRNSALASGIPLIETDYLNHYRSVNKLLTRYPEEVGSHPYSITISDPRPTLNQGLTYTIPFDVDQPIPAFAIPLNDESVPFDLGKVFDHTFETSRLLHQQCDYTQRPIDWDYYSPADQDRIEARMRYVKQLHESGIDLNTKGPFPIGSGFEGQNLLPSIETGSSWRDR